MNIIIPLREGLFGFRVFFDNICQAMSSEQEIRRRPLHGQEGEGEGEDWGVDDEGWTPEEETEETKRKHVARRTVTEIALAFLCHLLLMCYYIYAHVYDATIFKQNAGKGFEGSGSYGGRWKYLTYLNYVRFPSQQCVSILCMVYL